MSNNYFEFKQFRINHDKCAMKVGTDGVLIGAWAPGGKRILDIGTGTGLIAIMMAQRFEKSTVEAIEINEAAAQQAVDNAAHSPFSERVMIFQESLQSFTISINDNIDERIAYDSIVCNPPFYTETTSCPEENRNTARHTSSLSYKDLLKCSSILLSTKGNLSVIVPAKAEDEIRYEAALCGLFVNKICYVKTKASKPCKRIMVNLSKLRNEEFQREDRCLMNDDGTKSRWYSDLTKEFYL